MQSALRPYATAGVALVGASVIAISPVIATPTAIEQVREDAVELSASVDPIAVFRQLIQTTITEAQTTGQAIINNPAPILPQLIRNQLGQALNLPENLVSQLDVIPNLPELLPGVAAHEIADLQALGQAGQDFLTNIVDGITQGDLQAQLQLAIDAAKGGDFGSAFNDLAALPLVTLLGHEFGNLLLISTVGATLEKPIQDLTPLLPIVGQPLENLGNVVAALPIQAVLVGLPAITPLNTTAQALGETLEGFIAAAQSGDPGVAFEAVVTQAAAVTQAFLNVAVAPDGGGLVSGLQNLREAIAEAIGKPAPAAFAASATALPNTTAKSVTLTAPLKEIASAPKSSSATAEQTKGSATVDGATASGTDTKATSGEATPTATKDNTQGRQSFHARDRSSTKGGRHRADTGSFAQGLRDSIKGLTGLGREKKSDKETSGASASKSGESASSSSGSGDSGSGGDSGSK